MTASTGGGGPTVSGQGREGQVWSVLRLMRWSGGYLESKGVERGRLDAEHLLAGALGIERLQLYLQFDRPLTAEELDRFRPLLLRRANREPLQYILGRAAFRELELNVDRRALIPRPETEVLVDEVLTWARATGRDDLSAVDLGTGAGAIALSLALEGPFDRVVATDVSADALALARENALASGLQERIEWREGELFDALGAEEMFDLVVSNPPYVTDAALEALQPEVGEWEPALALAGGPDGMTVLRAIISGAAGHLGAGGLLALEIGVEQSGPVVALVEEAGRYDDVRVRRDFTGRERMVLARRAGRDVT